MLRFCGTVVAVIGAAAILCGSAAASCATSTPSGSAYADALADGDEGLAPEIGTVVAAVDTACTYAVDPGIDAPLVGDDAVFVYVDTDGNPATGHATFVGADVVIGSLGVTGPDPAPLLGVYDPATTSFSFAAGVSLAPVGVGGFAASLDQLGVPSGATTTVRVGTIWQGSYDDYYDFAPEPSEGPLKLDVAFSTVAAAPIAPIAPPPAPPAPPVVPAPPAGSGAPSTPVAEPPADDGADAQPRGCKVPRVARLRRSIAVRMLRAAGCRVGLTRLAYSATVPRGRVIRASQLAGARTAGRVSLVVSRGKRPRGAHASSVPLIDVARSLEDAAADLAAHAGA